MKTETSASKTWKRFCEWMTFSLFLTSTLVVAQAVAKIPDRVSLPDAHWLMGTMSMSMFFFARALLILGVSTAISIIAAASGVDSPYSKILKTKSDAAEGI